MTRASKVVNRWLPLVLALGWLVLAVDAVVEHHTARAVLGGLAALGFACLFAAHLRAPSPVPAHVDDAWAHGVLAEAGEPTGVAAVKALRVAEPALSLLQAKELADRVVR